MFFYRGKGAVVNKELIGGNWELRCGGFSLAEGLLGKEKILLLPACEAE